MPISSWRLFFFALQARTYPRLIWMVRNRTWLLQETLLPVLSVTALSYLYQWMGAPREYVGMVILGAAMTTFWLNVLWSLGAQLYWERDSGNLEIYVMAPAPMMGILAGMALGGMSTTLVRATTILVTGHLLFGIPFQPSSWWLLGLVFALTMLSLYGLGMMFASIFLSFGREAWHTVNLLQEPVYLMTGMNFPLKSLANRIGMVIPSIALLIPLTAGIDAMRQVLFGEQVGFLKLEYEILILSALGVVFLGLSKVTLDSLERKAKRDGTLTVKWQ